jgi:putative DNA primase/helicase
MDQIPPTSSYSVLTHDDRLAMGIRRVGAVRLNDIEPAFIQWLWPGRIPLGYVTLLVSDPGAGKSLLALDIAARVTTARRWPDQCSRHRAPDNRLSRVPGRRAVTEPSNGSPQPPNPQSEIPNPKSPGSVLLLTIEDHFANTVRPRLDALGADCSRILGLSHVPGEGVYNMPRPVAINRDINRIELLLREMTDCRLIILDPITAFFGDTSNRSTGNIWKILSNLSWLAASANLAVLAVSHLRKKEGAALHRAMGSLAYIAAARAAWTIASDPADAGRRLFLPLKNNLAESAAGLAFTIESSPSSGGPVLRWLPDPVETRAKFVLEPNRPMGRPDGERQFAIEWLSAYLSNGSLSSRTVRQAAEANGVSCGTLRRAFRDIGVIAFQPKNVLHGPWMWKLPGSDAQKSVGEFCATDQFTDEFAEHVSN